jgi:hypothetical protein
LAQQVRVAATADVGYELRILHSRHTTDNLCRESKNMLCMPVPGYRTGKRVQKEDLGLTEVFWTEARLMDVVT